MKRLRTFKGLKAGTRIRVVANSNSHNYVIGRTYTLSTDGDGYDMMDVEGNEKHNNLVARDCALAVLTVDELRQLLITLQNRYEEESKSIKSQIEFCEKNGLKEYNDEYTVIASVLESLSEDASLAEKVVKIHNAVYGS